MDLKLDAFGDLDIGADDLQLISGPEAVSQHLRIRLRLFKGEWFLDTRIGVPYFQRLLGAKTSGAAVKALFRKAILGTPGVKGVTALAIDYDNPTRRLTVRFDAVVTGTEVPIQFKEEVIL